MKISREGLRKQGWVTTSLLPDDREALERKRYIVWSSRTSYIVGTEEATEEAAMESAKDIKDIEDAEDVEEGAKEVAEAAEGGSEAAK